MAGVTFQDYLEFGKIAESHIAKWLLKRGRSVLPVYEKEFNDGKGPRLFSMETDLIAPDMLVFSSDSGIVWVEAKHKTAFTWHRITQRWVTGIDLKHYQHYCDIADKYNHPVWLLFLHIGGQAKDSPPDSPSGLFGNNLDYLRQHENHRHINHGKFGMVYWAIKDLRKLAELEDL